MSKSLRIVIQSIVVATAPLLALGCSKGESRSKDPGNRQIFGIWTKARKSTEQIDTLMIGRAGKYRIFSNMQPKNPFVGDYTIGDSLIRLVDIECGTALPGVYRVSVRDTELEFTMVEDFYCTRNQVLPGIWKLHKRRT